MLAASLPPSSIGLATCSTLRARVWRGGLQLACTDDAPARAASNRSRSRSLGVLLRGCPVRSERLLPVCCYADTGDPASPPLPPLQLYITCCKRGGRGQEGSGTRVPCCKGRAAAAVPPGYPPACLPAAYTPLCIANTLTIVRLHLFCRQHHLPLPLCLRGLRSGVMPGRPDRAPPPGG